MRQFSIGEVVTWIPDLLLRSETHGDYRIVASMPERDGELVYRIKSPLEEYDRVVKAGLLVKSTGDLPEEALKESPRPRSITLATLQARGKACKPKVTPRH
jgi:aminopeptidase-like protein